jgi:hypothetical protein
VEAAGCAAATVGQGTLLQGARVILGLVTDIHEDVPALRWALATLRSERADRIVCLGDVCEDGRAIDETCSLLAESGVVGVWGNHDFGICTMPINALALPFRPATLSYLRSYSPRLVIEDCHFSHIEPCLDPESVVDLWQTPDVPNSAAGLERNWVAVPERRMFMGHLHRWYAGSSVGVSDWLGSDPLATGGPGRHLVVIGAVCDGCCATLDTVTGWLRPFHRRG